MGRVLPRKDGAVRRDWLGLITGWLVMIGGSVIIWCGIWKIYEVITR